MKSNIKIVSTLLVALALFLLISGISYASGNDSDNVKLYNRLSKNGIKSLTKAIQSENVGLRRSAIYISGVFEVPEMVDPLIEQLRIEKNPSVKNFIALSLYKIGKERGLEAIMDVLEKDNDRIPDHNESYEPIYP